MSPTPSKPSPFIPPPRRNFAIKLKTLLRPCLWARTLFFRQTGIFRFPLTNRFVSNHNGKNRCSNSKENFWLLRNSFGGNVGGGTGFRVGPYSGSEEATYTISENEPFTLGYLFDGSDRLSDDKNVKFFFNGENKFVSLEEDKNSTPAAPSLGDSVKLNFWQEDESEDTATMTIQKAVFYKPVE